MAEDWTVDIPLRTPSERQASKDEVTTTGTVLGNPAILVTKGSSIRLKVSGFASQTDAENACPRLCFGLRYMSLQVPIAVQFELYPQKIAFSADPREAAKNLSRSCGGADFGTEAHGIISDGAPAIYPTGHTMRMFVGGDVRMTISGLGKPGQALQWIADGAEIGASASQLDDEVTLAVELFNLAGFEPSHRAAFIVHCTALEQLFPAPEVDEFTTAQIEKLAANLKQEAAAASSDGERDALLRLRERILFLKRDSIARAVRAGVVRALAADDAALAATLIADLKEIYGVRNKLSHEGRADLGGAPQQVTNVLKQVLLKKLAGLRSHPISSTNIPA